MHALKLFFVVSCMLTIANSEVALVIGGFGASDSVQVITKDATCLGLSSNPVIPKAPDGRVGWVGQVSTSCPPENVLKHGTFDIKCNFYSSR